MVSHLYIHRYIYVESRDTNNLRGFRNETRCRILAGKAKNIKVGVALGVGFTRRFKDLLLTDGAGRWPEGKSHRLIAVIFGNCLCLKL